MNRLIWLVLPVLLLAAVACSSGPDKTQTGTAVFTISDAATDMESVSEIELKIDGLKVQGESGAWTTVSTDAKTYSLLDLNSRGAASLLAEVELEPGVYSQVQLDISSVTVVDARGEHEASVPSNELVFDGRIEVVAEATSSADFDFIAHESLHTTIDGEFVFAPVIEIETKSNVEATIDANSDVTVSGGDSSTTAKVGTDVSGNVGAGLLITPDAMLDVSASGALVQVGGNGIVKATVKSVNQADGTVTIATRTGAEIQLQVAADSTISVDGSVSTLAELNGRIGSTAIVEYNAKNGAIVQLIAEGDGWSQAEINLKLSGTITAVNESDNTVTVQTEDGAEVSLSLASNLVGSLSGAVGTRVDAEYNSSTRTATEIEARAEAEPSTAAGVVASLDASAGRIVLVTSSGAELTLKVNSDSELMIDGNLATIANVSSRVGSEIDVTFDAATNVVASANVAADAEANSEMTVSGTIESVQPLAGTVTIAADNGQRLVLDVTGRTQILVGGALSSLVSLAIHTGESVKVRYDADTDAALRIESSASATASAGVDGTLKSVDTASGAVTIVTDSGQQMVLKVTSSTRVVVDGVVTGLESAAGKIDADVKATYDVETKIASDIQVDAYASAEASVNGTIQAVGTAAGTITVAAENGQQVVLELKSDTQILVNGAASSVVELAAQVGSQVTVTYDASARVATEVRASASASATASAAGVVEAVNVAAGTITVAVDSGEELVLKINSTTKATLNGSSSALAELVAHVGATVEVTYDVESKLASIVDVEAEGNSTSMVSADGTLQSANALTGEVIVVLDSGTEMALEITSETEIVVNGVTSTAADLATKTGAKVTATYDAETNALIKLMVD